MKKFIEEFKAFIAKGNVVDMAVGVVVGAAFKSIVDSFVADIVMPAISLLTGKVNIAALAVTIPNPLDPEIVLISLNYGNFLQQILNFLLIAFSMFIMIKAIGSFRKKMEKHEEPKQDEPPKPTTEELLTQIRDLLEKENDKK